MKAVEAAFGEEQKEEDLDRHQKAMPRDRFLVAYDGEVPVGTTASLPFDLTVPGGELAAGGVTWVGVLPSHRRRGILTQMMKRQLEELHERGEPLAILWASEAAIYGRFGYGISVPMLQLDADRSRFSLRDDPGPKGAVRLIDREEAARLLPPIYDTVRDRVPGFTSRSEKLWDLYRLADPEHWRRGAGAASPPTRPVPGAAGRHAASRAPTPRARRLRQCSAHTSSSRCAPQIASSTL